MTESSRQRQQTGRITRVCADLAEREAGCGMAAHHYHSYYELYYLLQGRSRFIIDNSLIDLQAGDFILIPPQVFHYTLYQYERCVRGVIYFRAEDIGEGTFARVTDPGSFFTRPHIFRSEASARPRMDDVMQCMFAEEHAPDEKTPYMQYCLLQELFILMARFCTSFPALAEKTRTVDRQTMLAARFISENYMNPITAAEIAAAAGFSPNHLSKRFREDAGVGVHEYLVNTRLQHAALELISTDDSITAIALRCGFSDSNYFKDVFKKKYGVTPRVYRKSH